MSIWKKIVLSIIGSGAGQIINFIFGILLVRILIIEEYAVWKQGNLILTTTMPFLLIVSPVALSYFLSKAKDKSEKKGYVFQTIYSTIIISLFGGVILFLIKDVIIEMYSNYLLDQYYIVFCIIMLLESSCSFYTYFMIAEDRNKKLVFYTVLFSLLRIIALLFTLVFYKQNILFGFMYSYLIAVLIKFIIIIFDTCRYYRDEKLIFNKQNIYNQLMFSIPIMITGIINTLNITLDKNLVASLYSPEQYSIYVNGAFEIPFVGVLSSSIITVMLPHIGAIYKENDVNIKLKIIESYKSIIDKSCLLIFPLIITIYFFAEGVIILLFSESYLLSLNLFKIYLFMLVFKCFNFGVLITAADKQKYLVVNGICMLIANCIFLYIIKNTLGFNYLTLAVVLSNLVCNILMLFNLKKIYKFNKCGDIIPYKNISVYLIICIVVVGIFRFIANILSLNVIVETIIFLPISYITCLGLCIMLTSNRKFNVRGLTNGNKI